MGARKRCVKVLTWELVVVMVVRVVMRVVLVVVVRVVVVVSESGCDEGN